MDNLIESTEKQKYTATVLVVYHGTADTKQEELDSLDDDGRVDELCAGVASVSDCSDPSSLLILTHS